MLHSNRRMFPAPSRAWAWPLLTLLLTTVACTGRIREDPILQLSAVEALAAGKELMAQEKYLRARPYLTHAFEVEPNTVTGREGLLLAADSYFLEGNRAAYIQSEAKFRDFLNRFPTSDRAAYAHFQRANSLAKQMERPDRDQKTTRKALETFQELMRLYPTSEYAAQAREQIQVVRANLAEHEYVVAHFYYRFKLPRAAVGRLEKLLENFPDYGEKDKVLFELGQSYAALKQADKANSAFDRLKLQFPDSPLIEEIPVVAQPPIEAKPAASATPPAAAASSDENGPR